MDDSQDAESDDVSVTLSLEYSDSDTQQSEDVDGEGTQSPNSDSSDDEDEWGTRQVGVPDFNFNDNRSGILVDPGETPIEIFNSLWNKDINDIILVSSNNYMCHLESSTRPHQKYTRIQKYKEISETELKHFLGICILSGQRNYPSVRKMFSKDVLYYSPIYKHVLSGRRFEQILRCFSCELIPTVCVEKPQKLDKIVQLHNCLVNNFQKTLYPGEQLSLDESLLLFRGRLSFRQFMKGKKSKYGIKFFELTTPDGYVLNINIYAGKSDESNAVPKTLTIVEKLAELYLDQGHHIYLDNFYNSIQLSEYLLSRKTHSTGTLRKNRNRNPRKVIHAKVPKGEQVWAERNNIRVSKWKDKRIVFSITTGHTTELIECQNSRGISKTKPKHIVEYTKNMRGVDRCDQMVSYYSSPRKTLRWYKKVMLHYLDVTLYNAYYLYKLKINQTKMTFLEFREIIIRHLLDLSDKKDLLCDEILVKRSHSSASVQHYLEIIPKPPGWKRNKYQLKCSYCTKNRKKVSYTMYRCKMCIRKPVLCPAPCFELAHRK